MTCVCKSCKLAAVCLLSGYDEMVQARLDQIVDGIYGAGWTQWEKAREGTPWNCPARQAQKDQARREAVQRIRDAVRIT